MSSKEIYLEKGIINASLSFVWYHSNSHMSIAVIWEIKAKLWMEDYTCRFNNTYVRTYDLYCDWTLRQNLGRSNDAGT